VGVGGGRGGGGGGLPLGLRRFNHSVLSVLQLLCELKYPAPLPWYA
jgi:hypothetical protein